MRISQYGANNCHLLPFLQATLFLTVTQTHNLGGSLMRHSVCLTVRRVGCSEGWASLLVRRYQGQSSSNYEALSHWSLYGSGSSGDLPQIRIVFIIVFNFLCQSREKKTWLVQLPKIQITMTFRLQSPKTQQASRCRLWLQRVQLVEVIVLQRGGTVLYYCLRSTCFFFRAAHSGEGVDKNNNIMQFDKNTTTY